jgi:hypothetical protein
MASLFGLGPADTAKLLTTLCFFFGLMPGKPDLAFKTDFGGGTPPFVGPTIPTPASSLSLFFPLFSSPLGVIGVPIAAPTLTGAPLGICTTGIGLGVPVRAGVGPGVGIG